MIGKILGNRYRLIELIGEGGMALVYKAECSLLCRTVAIKILRPQYASDAEFVERFRREARSAASLSHPNIVNIYDVGQDDGMDFIVMEYIPGGTLKSIIAREAPLGVERALEITRQILEGLNHAHQRNIIHRDIKPHNILVTPEGRIKVTDFGIARALSAGSLTQTGEVMGSVQYSSPEQAKGLMMGPQSDLYSCGCVLYELLTGKVPYKGDTPIAIAFQHLQGDIPPVRQVRSDITPEVESILNKALSKDLSERYPSALAMLKDIHTIRLKTGPEDGLLEETDEPTQIWRSPKRDGDFKGNSDKKHLVLRIVAGLAGGLLLIALSVFLVFFVFAPPQPEVEVPNLLRSSFSRATELLKEHKLQIRVINRIYNSEYPPETIISQKPAPGQKKRMGSEVEVVVSRGSKLVKIPDLTGKTRLEAELALEEVGLKLADILTDTSIEQPENTVIRQLPEKNTQIEQGAGVSITLNVMPGNLIQVPNFIGRPFPEVRAELSPRWGLSFNKAQSVPSSIYEEGIITDQDPAPSFQVPPGTAMNFIVSSGPPRP
ncbi:MAG TPA: Stk1 family PASTA domain-containing Ser/Thr kinase [Bacillota bacterium]|nr:Stk1 family PASTA domain-containing Ser/Thr kinase [Bacillota bacterium]